MLTHTVNLLQVYYCLHSSNPAAVKGLESPIGFSQTYNLFNLACTKKSVTLNG